MYQDRLIEAIDEMVNDMLISRFSNPLEKPSDEEITQYLLSEGKTTLDQYLSEVVKEIMGGKYAD